MEIMKIRIIHVHTANGLELESNALHKMGYKPLFPPVIIQGEFKGTPSNLLYVQQWSKSQ